MHLLAIAGVAWWACLHHHCAHPRACVSPKGRECSPPPHRPPEKVRGNEQEMKGLLDNTVGAVPVVGDITNTVVSPAAQPQASSTCTHSLCTMHGSCPRHYCHLVDGEFRLKSSRVVSWVSLQGITGDNSVLNRIPGGSSPQTVDNPVAGSGDRADAAMDMLNSADTPPPPPRVFEHEGDST